MLRVALVALLATSACRISLEGDDAASDPDGGGRKCTVNTANAECAFAEANPAMSQTLTWIEQNVFAKNCNSTACHSPTTGGGMPGGGVVLTTASFDKLVNVDAKLANGYKLVVPGDLAKSYLMVLLQDLPLSQADPPAPAPRDNLYMPFNSPPICCQKLDAIQRWIMAGAMNN
jgi:hypothetical protein